jgi:GGDEF domain-containing protein
LLFRKFWKLGLSSDPRKLPVLKGIHTAEEFSKILRRERERADRNGHRFSLIFFEIDHKDRTSKGLIELAEALSRRIRLTDEVGWLDGHLGVFLPETPPQGAGKVADDICRMVQSVSPLPRYHLYCYPIEGGSSPDKKSASEKPEKPAHREKHLDEPHSGENPAGQESPVDQGEFLKNRLAGSLR